MRDINLRDITELFRVHFVPIDNPRNIYYDMHWVYDEFEAVKYAMFLSRYTDCREVYVNWQAVENLNMVGLSVKIGTACRGEYYPTYAKRSSKE